MAKQSIIDQAKARWKQWVDAEHNQVDRERDDLSFYEGTGVWPEDIKRARAGQTGQASGRPPIPARPCLTINKQRQPVNHVINGIRQTEFGVEVVPADDFVQQGGPIDHSEIELREDMLRRIQRESDAMEARQWAVDRAVKAGRGYYGVMTRYCPGKTFDQEVYYRGFYDQSQVALDPAREMLDGSDAGWGFVTTKMRWNEYEGQYPEAAKNFGVAIEGFSSWDEFSKSMPDWFKGISEDGSKEVTRVIPIREHWYREDTTRTLYVIPATPETPETFAYSDELPEGFDTKGLESREVTEQTVKFLKTDGINELETTEWPSKWIPIFEVIGERIQPFDNERRAEGMIRPMREPVFGESVMVSSLVETIGLAPKTPTVGYAGQFEGFEDAWDAANVRNIPRLEVNPTVDGAPGQVMPIPQRMPGPAPETINAISGSIQMFDEFIKSTSGIPDPTLGNVDPSVRSGKAIKTLLDQAKMGSTQFLDNLIVTMKHEARVVNSLLEPIYGRRPGRLVRLMTGERNPMPAIIGQPFVVVGEGKNKTAQPFNPMQHQGMQPKTYTLTPDADWNIAVKVSKNFDTRREAQTAQVTELVNNAPEMLLPVMGDLMFEYDDGPASPQIAKRMKVILNPAIQQMEQGQQPLPPEAQAQMSQMQQQIQEMQQALAQAQQIIQTEQIKTQGAIEKVKTEAQSKAMLQDQQLDGELALQVMKNAASIAVAHISAASKGAAIQAHAEEEAQALGHEAMQKDLDRAHQFMLGEQARNSQEEQGEQQKG